jgi:uncharacterized protein
MGYPAIFALLLANAFVLVPVELGYLLYQEKKKTGRFTLQGIIFGIILTWIKSRDTKGK